MEYDGVNSIVCDAEEVDWLDVSYSERKYVNETQPEQVKTKKKFTIKWNKPLKIAVIALLCVAVLAAMLFMDGNFGKDVFQTAKEAFSASLFGVNNTQDVASTIALPSNINLVDINDGVATFGGGRATLSFTNGMVSNVSETSVTVQIDDTTCITYDGLTTVYVAVGDAVSANSLLGKYDGTFTATISVDGQTVQDVVGSESQLTWQV